VFLQKVLQKKKNPTRRGEGLPVFQVQRGVRG
jgi:hypothetical protein